MIHLGWTFGPRFGKLHWVQILNITTYYCFDKWGFYRILAYNEQKYLLFLLLPIGLDLLRNKNVGVGFGWLSGLIRLNPTKWEMGGIVSDS